MVTDADQDAHNDQRNARTSVKVERLVRMQDGSDPPALQDGESEYDQPRWIRHHRPERAAAEGDIVFGEEG